MMSSVPIPHKLTIQQKTLFAVPEEIAVYEAQLAEEERKRAEVPKLRQRRLSGAFISSARPSTQLEKDLDLIAADMENTSLQVTPIPDMRMSLGDAADIIESARRSSKASRLPSIYDKPTAQGSRFGFGYVRRPRARLLT